MADPRLRVYQTLHNLRHAAPIQWVEVMKALAVWQDKEVLDVVRASPERVLVNQGRAQMFIEIVGAMDQCTEHVRKLQEKMNGTGANARTAAVNTHTATGNAGT